MLDTLRLFNEKADKLDKLSYTEWVRKNRIGFTVRNRGDGVVEAKVRAPHDESVDAFVLTLRFFIQDNESISIAKIAALYEHSDLADDLRMRVADERRSLNELLDQSSQITIAGETFTKNQIFNVFLWGGLAHANVEKKKTFDRWASDPILFPVMQTAFHSVVMELLRSILWMRNLNETVIDDFSATTF